MAKKSVQVLVKGKKKNNNNNNNNNSYNKRTQPSGPSVLSAPSLSQTSRQGAQSEIILQVRKGPNEIVIHPDNTRWLGEAAPSFQKWGMHDLTVWYEPRVATSTNGQVALTFLSDYADQSPTTLEDTVVLAGAKRGNPWSRFQLPKQRNRLFDYCSLNDFAVGDQITRNLRSPGRVVVYADMDASFDGGDVVGWVYISYTPVLHEPILRRLQLGGGSGGGGVPGGGQSGGYNDFYHYVHDYSNSRDFLGMNSELDPNYYVSMTNRIWYVYDVGHNQCLVTNVSNAPVTVYLTCLLQDVTLLGNKRNILFQESGTHAFPGNKGLYSAWDNSDAWFKFAGVIEPNGFLSIDNSILTKWGNSEVFLMELGNEHGPIVVPTRPLSTSRSISTVTLTSSWPVGAEASAGSDQDVPSNPAPPTVPSSGNSYDLTSFSKISGELIRPYHELINFGGPAYPFVLSDSGTSGGFNMYQSTPNGNGYLTYTENGNQYSQLWSWTDTPSSLKPIGVVAYGGGYVLQALGDSVKGYMGPPTNTTGDGSAYGGAAKSITSTYVRDISLAIVWSFSKA